MAKWTVKGAVDNEPKSKKETEQAVLDKAVEKGEIDPQQAGKESDETPKINLDAVQKQSTDEVPVRDESETSGEVQEENKEVVEEVTGESEKSDTVQDEQPVVEEITEEISGGSKVETDIKESLESVDPWMANKLKENKDYPIPE